jgi:small-conductance mechanosensitive channel
MMKVMIIYSLPLLCAILINVMSYDYTSYFVSKELLQTFFLCRFHTCLIYGVLLYWSEVSSRFSMYDGGFATRLCSRRCSWSI